MMIIDQLVVQHQTLRNKTAVDPDSVQMNELLALMDQVRAASAHIEEAQQREQLQAILYHWNSYIHDKTGTYPATQLLPYAPVAAVATPISTEMTTRTGLPLPNAPWLGWVLAVILVVAGFFVIIWPRLTAVPEQQITPEESTALALTAVAVTETAVYQAATATRESIMQTSEAAALMFVATATPSVEAVAPEVGQPISYTVRAGDTLVGISQKYGTTVDDIRTLNNLTTDTIAIGQLLWLPAPAIQPEAEAVPDQTAVPLVVTPVLPAGQVVIELVVRSHNSVLQSGPGPEFTPIYALARGTFAYVVGRNQAHDWYLIQLEDGATRGWVLVADVGLLHPALPDAIPVVTTP